MARKQSLRSSSTARTREMQSSATKNKRTQQTNSDENSGSRVQSPDGTGNNAHHRAREEAGVIVLFNVTYRRHIVVAGLFALVVAVAVMAMMKNENINSGAATGAQQVSKPYRYC